MTRKHPSAKYPDSSVDLISLGASDEVNEHKG